ncbi:MAG: single-stranded-DNA-specific exonuclease RecJ, partial [Anaplasma sp.]
MHGLLEKAQEYAGIQGGVWRVHDVPHREVEAIRQKFGLCEVVARILAMRSVRLDEINDFLFPTLKLLLPDPFHLLDMDKAIDRIVGAVRNKESIAIFGDYDVDGATSSAMLYRYFSGLGVRSRIYIPDR